MEEIRCACCDKLLDSKHFDVHMSAAGDCVPMCDPCLEWWFQYVQCYEVEIPYPPTCSHKYHKFWKSDVVPIETAISNVEKIMRNIGEKDGLTMGSVEDNRDMYLSLESLVWWVKERL